MIIGIISAIYKRGLNLVSGWKGMGFNFDYNEEIRSVKCKELIGEIIYNACEEKSNFRMKSIFILFNFLHL